MATSKRWSRTVGVQRGTRTRVFERTVGGPLYLAVWVSGRGTVTRSLGHRDRERALQQARELASLRATGEFDGRRPFTLGELLARYLAENRHARDGSLKTERYLRNCATYARNLTAWFGAACQVEGLIPDRMGGYVQARRAGKVSGKGVRARSVQAELSFLKSALRWASGVFQGGKPLLASNPLAVYSPPRERDPRRPMISHRTVAALRAVAPQVHPLLPLLLDLMDGTGRRLSSVLGLRWDDFDFQAKTIRWRPELDKRRRTWVTPMSNVVEAALLHARVTSPAIGSTLLFPAPRNPDKAVSVYLASKWLLKAYRSAVLKREPGGLWHPFRRKWATERKSFPLRDVAAAGGWSSTETLLTCYQQPDPDTLREVVNASKSRGEAGREAGREAVEKPVEKPVENRLA